MMLKLFYLHGNVNTNDLQHSKIRVPNTATLLEMHRQVDFCQNKMAGRNHFIKNALKNVEISDDEVSSILM
jgi:hypothetical protein